MQVTLVEPRGSSIGRIGVGDQLVAINNRKLNDIKVLNEELAKARDDVSVMLRRNSLSCCKFKQTTVETLTVEKGSGIKVMRAIAVYLVQIRIEKCEEIDEGEEFGLSVKYDNKERLQVAKVDPGSLSSVHLKPGDIIREVDGQSVASKAMFFFWIRHGIHKNRQVLILIETGVGDVSQIEMPEDVQMIAQKQIALAKNMKLPAVKSILRRNSPTDKKHVILCESISEMGICSDFDETTLKHVRKEK